MIEALQEKPQVLECPETLPISSIELPSMNGVPLAENPQGYGL
jgi:hypothetical protein